MTQAIPSYLPSLGRLIGHALRATSSLSEQRLRPHGITLAHWVILTALWRQDEMTVGQLARYSKSTDAVLSRTLDRMAQRGLVERLHDPGDRRVVRVRLTRKGKDLSHLLGFYHGINRTLMKGFSKDEKSTLFALLERVVANADRALEAQGVSPDVASFTASAPR
jgi:DNA-binding MarR family transcriptional regulator